MIDDSIKPVIIDEFEDDSIRCTSLLSYNVPKNRWELHNKSTPVIFFANPEDFARKILMAAVNEIQPRKEKLEKALEAWKKVMESD